MEMSNNSIPSKKLLHRQTDQEKRHPSSDEIINYLTKENQMLWFAFKLKYNARIYQQS